MYVSHLLCFCSSCRLFILCDGFAEGSVVKYCHGVLLQIRHFNSTALLAFRGTNDPDMTLV